MGAVTNLIDFSFISYNPAPVDRIQMAHSDEYKDYRTPPKTRLMYQIDKLYSSGRKVPKVCHKNLTSYYKIQIKPPPDPLPSPETLACHQGVKHLPRPTHPLGFGYSDVTIAFFNLT